MGLGILKVKARVFMRVEDDLGNKWTIPETLAEAHPYLPTEEAGWMYLSVPAEYGRDELGLPPKMEIMLKRPVIRFRELTKEGFHPGYFAYQFGSIQNEQLAIWQIRMEQKCRGKLLLGGGTDGETRIRKQEDGYILSEFPDVVYDEPQRKLYFRDVRKIKSLLPKLSGLLMEENRKIARSLMETGMVAYAGDLNDKEVTMENLRRIPAAVQQLERFSPEEKTILRDYVAEVYQGRIAYDTNRKRFITRTNRELKDLLLVILEMVYITRITKQYRVARGITPVKNRIETGAEGKKRDGIILGDHEGNADESGK